jgi:hypothetical protein
MIPGALEFYPGPAFLIKYCLYLKCAALRDVVGVKLAPF